MSDIEYEKMKARKDALVKEEENRFIILGYNAGLEWAAGWITGALSGYPDNLVEWAKAQAMTLRAAKKDIPQENFFDAVRNDPTMSQEMKDYWLAQEPKEPKP
jgi:hypothetical protein